MRNLRGLLDFNHTRNFSSVEEWRDKLEEIYRLIEGNIGFGEPITMQAGSEAGQHQGQIRGSWVEKTITAATGTATFTHNLGIPTTSVTGAGDTANRLNVRWLVMGAEYGDRTGTNVAPAAPGGFSINLLHMSDAAVTTTSIDLLYAVNGFTPSATAPLYLSVFFTPASR